MRNTLTGIAAALLASSMLVGAASAETLRWARQSDALTLDPHSQNQGVTHTFNHHIYETLLDRDVEGNLQARLATDWYVKEGDETVWVFELREGVTFHGGEEFTAEDVVFSIERAKSENSNMRQLHADVESVAAVDDHTVEFQMAGPSPLYPNNITNTFIMDKGWSEANDLQEVQDFAAGEENFAVRNTNGTGPYVLAERDPDVRSVLTVNENWWGDAPAVTEIIYTPISDNATRVAALLSGEVDLVQDVPVQDIEHGHVPRAPPHHLVGNFSKQAENAVLVVLLGGVPHQPHAVRDAGNQTRHVRGFRLRERLAGRHERVQEPRVILRR